MADFLSGFPAGTITFMIFPFFLALPFPIPSPFWSGFVSRGQPHPMGEKMPPGGSAACEVCPMGSDSEPALAVLGPRVSDASPECHPRDTGELYWGAKPGMVWPGWGHHQCHQCRPQRAWVGSSWGCRWVGQTRLSHESLLCSPLP